MAFAGREGPDGQRPVISWTRPMLERFKAAYNRMAALEPTNDDAVFSFDGYEFVKGYARYLIEYLEGQLQ